MQNDGVHEGGPPSPPAAWWNIRQSWWVLLTLLPIGLGAWAAFLYAGVRARRRAWLYAAGVYGALLIFVLGSFALPMTWVPLAGGLTAIALWAVPFIHAIGVLPRYLHELRARRQGLDRASPEDLFFPGTFVRRTYPVHAAPSPLLHVLVVIMCLATLGYAILGGFSLYGGMQGALAGAGHLGVPGQVVVGHCPGYALAGPCTGTFSPSDPAAVPASQKVSVEGRPKVGEVESVRLLNGTAWPPGWAAAPAWSPMLALGLAVAGSLGAGIFYEGRRRWGYVRWFLMRKGR